ncbi:hypothetical protein TWF718_002832 [Orbilia javanica]|uniref:Uncharacterized protein n=1 Tax=Orbilia javanica TaxID=47235 RepID=A0AAN8RJ56_9PEZI
MANKPDPLGMGTTDIKQYRLHVTHQVGWESLRRAEIGTVKSTFDQPHAVYTVQYADTATDPGRRVFKNWQSKQAEFSKLVVALYNPATEDLIMADEIDQIPSMTLGSRRVPHPHLKFPNGVVITYTDAARYKWCPVYRRSDVGWGDMLPLGTWDNLDAFADFVTLCLGLWDEVYPALWIEDIQEGLLILTGWGVIKYKITCFFATIYKAVKALVLGYWLHALVPVVVMILFPKLPFAPRWAIPEVPLAPCMSGPGEYRLQPREKAVVMGESRWCTFT